MSLSAEEKKELLTVARKAIEATLAGRRADNTSPDGDALNEDAGAFATLRKKGRLRGCIGVFTSKDPLWKTVQHMAVSAATQDPRFAPVEEEELNQIDIEISVLSPLQKIENIDEIEVGRHGLYIMQGPYKGCLLPQVATECGLDRDTFLAETCMKASLPPDVWQKGADIYVFEAEVFGEREQHTL